MFTERVGCSECQIVSVASQTVLSFCRICHAVQMLGNLPGFFSVTAGQTVLHCHGGHRCHGSLPYQPGSFVIIAQRYLPLRLR